MSQMHDLNAHDRMAFAALCEAHAAFRITSETLSRDPGPRSQLAQDVILEQRDSTETHALRLAENLKFDRESQEAAVKSFSSRILQVFPKIASGAFTLEKRQWQILLNFVTPEDLEIMVSRGLGIGAIVPEVFSALAKHTRVNLARSQRIAEIIAEHIGPVERQIEEDGVPNWCQGNMLSVRTPLMAGYLEAQAKTFPDDIGYAVNCAHSYGNIDHLIILHLAGASIGQAGFGAAIQPRARALVAAAGSAHGRLTIRARTGTLEEYLSAAPITQWD